MENFITLKEIQLVAVLKSATIYSLKKTIAGFQPSMNGFTYFKIWFQVWIYASSGDNWLYD